MFLERRQAVLTGVAVLLSVACQAGPYPDSRARVVGGIVAGERLPGGVVAFRGVAYAAPPVGERRWRPPEPPAPWDGERDATRFAPACPQDEGTWDYYRRAARRLESESAAVIQAPRTSEDCLYLNVWRPAGARAARHPILVWVHGGAGTGGSPSDPLFDGAALAARGIVVVTVAYRLGALGFLAHPALSADDPRGVSGNYALLDLIRALEWIRDNGPAFGGDPDRVTLAGQSAGATLAQLLLATPAARGLFHRLIAQSGSALVSLPALRAEGGDSAEQLGRRFVQAASADAEADGATLRRLSIEALQAAAGVASASVPAVPVVDGVVLPQQPAHAIERGAYTPVPILTGFNDAETSLFAPPLPVAPDDYVSWVRQRYGSAADSILASYPPGADPEFTRRQRVRLLSDEGFGAPALLLARWTEGRSPVYLYRFSWQPDDGSVGAFHGAELPFLFGTHGMWWREGPDIRTITSATQEAWAHFAATGVPSAPTLPVWTAVSWDRPQAMVIDVPPAFEPLARLPALRQFAGALAARLTEHGTAR
jgi:para-nitrobenzyl esterase